MFGLKLPKNPLDALRSMTPAGRRNAIAALDVIEHPRAIPLRAVPDAFMVCFRDAGELYNVPAQLLAAVACVLTNFNVGFNKNGRLGLLAVPDGQAGAVVANENILCGVTDDGQPCGDIEVLEQGALVRANIDGGARELARLKEKFPSQGWAAIIAHYCDDDAVKVLGAFMLYIVGEAEYDSLQPLKTLREMLED